MSPKRTSPTTSVGYTGRMNSLRGGLASRYPPELEQMALAKLQQRCQDWQVRQARHALRLYRHFLASQQAESQASSVGRHHAQSGMGAQCSIQSRLPTSRVHRRFIAHLFLSHPT